MTTTSLPTSPFNRLLLYSKKTSMKKLWSKIATMRSISLRNLSRKILELLSPHPTHRDHQYMIHLRIERSPPLSLQLMKEDRDVLLNLILGMQTMKCRQLRRQFSNPFKKLSDK